MSMMYEYGDDVHMSMMYEYYDELAWCMNIMMHDDHVWVWTDLRVLWWCIECIQTLW